MADHWDSSSDLIQRVFGPPGSQFAPPSFNYHGPALGILYVNVLWGTDVVDTADICAKM